MKSITPQSYLILNRHQEVINQSLEFINGKLYIVTLETRR